VTGIRLQKALADAGLGSRRACEELITAGRVTVNGTPAELGMRVDVTRDEIRLDGEQVGPAAKAVWIALHKPRGVVSTARAQDERRTVVGLVQHASRLYPVGRLDAESEGLILLTNDGELAHRLTHPRFGLEREYRVLVAGEPDARDLREWRRGVPLADDKRSAPARVWVRGRTAAGVWLGVVMTEGRKREIREIARGLNLRVRRLIRVRYGSVTLGSLKPGDWRTLEAREVEALRRGEPEARPARPRLQSGARRRRPAAGARRRVHESARRA
jgi:23S rRNA pseudouridine2605 synthase